MRKLLLSFAIASGFVAPATAQNMTNRRTHVPLSSKSRAVAVARAHINAWSHHDWDRARAGLAPDVHVTATTTEPNVPPTDLTGADNYMLGLKQFAGAVQVGSARITSSIGDDRHALLTVTVKAALGPGGAMVTLPAARMYLLDENGKIKVEQVIFFAAPE